MARLAPPAPSSATSAAVTAAAAAASAASTLARVAPPAPLPLSPSSLPSRGRVLFWATLPALAALLGLLWLRRRRRRRPRSHHASAPLTPEAVIKSGETSSVVVISKEALGPVLPARRSSDDSPLVRRRRRRLSGSASIEVCKTSEGCILPFTTGLSEKSSAAIAAAAAVSLAAGEEVVSATSEDADNFSEKESTSFGGVSGPVLAPDCQQNGFGPPAGELHHPFAPATAEAKEEGAQSGEASRKDPSREQTPVVDETPLQVKEVTSLNSVSPAAVVKGEVLPTETLNFSEVPFVAEISAVTNEPSTIISEASIVTSKAPGIISEASALTSEASDLMKQVPAINCSTHNIVSKAPDLISEANALIKEAEAIQNAVPIIKASIVGEETTAFPGETPALFRKAPSLISEASALIKEAQALISEVPVNEHLLVKNIKASIAKNGDLAPNRLENYVVLQPNIVLEENNVCLEEVSSTNSTLAGVEDFDSFEVTPMREETRKSDYRGSCHFNFEVVSTLVEAVDEAVSSHKDVEQSVKCSEVSPSVEPLGVEESERRIEIPEPESQQVFSEVKGNYQVQELKVEDKVEEIVKGTINPELEAESVIDIAEGEVDSGATKIEIVVETYVSLERTPLLEQELEEVVVKGEELVPNTKISAVVEGSSKVEAALATPQITEEIAVKSNKLVATSAPTKRKRHKGASKTKKVEANVVSKKVDEETLGKKNVKSKRTLKSIDVEEVSSKVESVACKSLETSVKESSSAAVAAAAVGELVFPPPATAEAEVGPLVGAGEGTSAAPEEEVTSTRHPRSEGEEAEGVKASPKQGEVPALELARLLGQLRGAARVPAAGVEEMAPGSPGDSPAPGASVPGASAPAPRPVDDERSVPKGATTASDGAAAGQRDSANHSPAEGMLASPRAHDACSSLSGDEGDEEEGDSSDSGKGCSDAPTPPPSRTPASGSSVSGDVVLATCASTSDAGATEDAGEASAASADTAVAAAVTTGADARVYEFVLPQQLVGRLIGRHGCFVHQIKARTNASILIKRHPDTARLKVCAVEGSPADVEGALEMIRQKFPEKRYPHVSLEQVCFVSAPLPVVPVLPDCLRLQLVEGISNDVILSSLVSPAHFFLQQPTHPTFPALTRLCACMDATYGGDADTPAVPTVLAGIVVAAPVMGSWYRAEVVAAEPEAETCQVRYVDYGGYEVQQNSALRQIRSDFMTLPFQAAECYLANVICNGEEEGWSTEALSAVDQLTAGQVLQAQVCGYCEDGVPAVSLYAVSGSQIVSVSQELVARDLAQWWDPTDG